MNCRIKTMSSVVTTLPRYLQSAGICVSVPESKPERKPLRRIFISSRVARLVQHRSPDCQPRVATALDVPAMFSPVPCRWATT